MMLVVRNPSLFFLVVSLWKFVKVHNLNNAQGSWITVKCIRGELTGREDPCRKMITDGEVAWIWCGMSNRVEEGWEKIRGCLIVGGRRKNPRVDIKIPGKMADKSVVFLKIQTSNLEQVKILTNIVINNGGELTTGGRRRHFVCTDVWSG